jgi:hypothetical protein
VFSLADWVKERLVRKSDELLDVALSPTFSSSILVHHQDPNYPAQNLSCYALQRNSILSVTLCSAPEYEPALSLTRVVRTLASIFVRLLCNQSDWGA